MIEQDIEQSIVIMFVHNQVKQVRIRKIAIFIFQFRISICHICLPISYGRFPQKVKSRYNFHFAAAFILFTEKPLITKFAEFTFNSQTAETFFNVSHNLRIYTETV